MNDQLNKDLISLRKDLEGKIKSLAQAEPSAPVYGEILQTAQALHGAIVRNLETKSNLVDNSFNRQIRAHER